MDIYPNCQHIVVYYDHQMHLADSNGWCLEFSDSETTNRFNTLDLLLQYLSSFESWLSDNVLTS